jgi:hypothetical protein
MAFSLPNAPYKSDWAQPMPDYGAALNKGITAWITPRFQSEQLLQSMLGNKIKGVEAKYKEQLMQAQIQQALAAAEHSRRSAANTIDPITKELMLANAKKNIKTVEQGEENIPQAEAMLKEIDKALEVLPKHKGWFGPATPGLGWLTGPEARKRSITNEEYGPIEALFGRLVGPQAQELSHGNKVLATALNLAQGIKPGFNENYPIAYGKLNRIREELSSSLSNRVKKYQEAGGRQNIGSYQGFEPRTSFKNKEEFHNYMKSLSPHQRNLVKKALQGAS